MQSNLITHEEFSSLKNIGVDYNHFKVDECINNAHSDLQEVMGSGFFFDVIKNQNEIEYNDLINGSSFINEKGYDVAHKGLKSVLVDYTYSRYLYEINNSITPFGMVTKQYQDGETVDRNMIKDLVKMSNQNAATKWELIEDYLNVNLSTFPIWARQKNQNHNPTNNTFNTSKFTFLPSSKNRY